MIMWFGVGPGSKVAMGAISCFFPVALNVAGGMREIDKVLIRVGRSFRANTWQMVTKIYLPAMRHPMINGVRLGLGVALIGTLLAETKLSNRGIGFLVIQAYSLFNMPQMYALLIVLFVIAIGANALIGRIRRPRRASNEFVSMKLHFAYGSNMSRSHMAVRCPQAIALGTAVLAGWRSRGRHGWLRIDRAGAREPGARRSVALEPAISPRLTRTRTFRAASIACARCRCAGNTPATRLPNLRQFSPCMGGVLLSPSSISAPGRHRHAASRVHGARPRRRSSRWDVPQSYVRAIARWTPSRWHGAFAPEPGQAA